MSLSVERAIDGQAILWGSPTFEQCAIGWRETLKALKGAGKEIKVSQTRMMIEFPTEGRIIFRSLDDPDNARGHTADGIIVDEAPLVKEEAYYEVLRPIVSDTGGFMLLMGTPKGRNWFFREWSAAKDRPNSMSWQIPTLGVKVAGNTLIRAPHPLENPEFPFEEAQNLFAMMPQRVFEQEFLAQFTEDSGAVFFGVRDASVLSEGTPEIGHTYVMGIDWAKADDWTVISVIDCTAKKQVAVQRFNQLEYGFQIQRVKTAALKWRPQVVMAESNSMGEALIDKAREEGLWIEPFFSTQADKNRIVQRLSVAIERGEIQLLADTDQINELEAYDVTRTKTGQFRYGAPHGGHDDMVMALAIAHYAMEFSSGKAIIAIGDE